MTVAVKICGLSEAEHVDVAVAAGAALVGFVFFPPSPRAISIETAAALTARVPKHVRRVALTVDADDALLAEIVAGAGVDTLQLHGQESVVRVAEIKARFGLTLIKVLPISTAADVDAARAYEGVADMLLFDAKPPKDATRPGGNAVSFDWDLLAGSEWQVPWLLAGGLDAGNVAEALRRSGAPMVDVSSGVEDAPGVKNSDKIRAFIAAVNAA